MITPPFTKVIYGKHQKLAEWPPTSRVRRLNLWLRRLHRAQTIITCSWERFDSRWRPILEPKELADALAHRIDPDLWLDAQLIIHERLQYYDALR